jgi:hypothetical protein
MLFNWQSPPLVYREFELSMIDNFFSKAFDAYCGFSDSMISFIKEINDFIMNFSRRALTFCAGYLF